MPSHLERPDQWVTPTPSPLESLVPIQTPMLNLLGPQGHPPWSPMARKLPTHGHLHRWICSLQHRLPLILGIPTHTHSRLELPGQGFLFPTLSHQQHQGLGPLRVFLEL